MNVSMCVCTRRAEFMLLRVFMHKRNYELWPLTTPALTLRPHITIIAERIKIRKTCIQRISLDGEIVCVAGCCCWRCYCCCNHILHITYTKVYHKRVNAIPFAFCLH